mgnify:CR=1 FL=1
MIGKQLLTSLAVIAALSVTSYGQSKGKLPAHLSGPRPEFGSFLNHPAQTMSQIIAQVKHDKVVADRFERHFHMSKGELIAYLKELRPMSIKGDGSYWVYNAHDDGVIRARVYNLPSGTMVYADSAGKPILRLRCANPMTMGPNRKAEAAKAEMHDVEESVKIVSEEMTPVEEATSVATSTEPSMPYTFSEPEPIAPLEPIQEPGLPSQITSTSGSPIGLLTLGAIGTLVTLGSLDNGSNPPVPEPASALVLALPVLYLAAKRRAKKG